MRVFVGTFRDSNFGWIKERKLYNLPILKDKTDDFYPTIDALVLVHRNTSATAFKANFLSIVNSKKLADLEYKVNSKHKNNMYALYSLGCEIKASEILSDSSSEIYTYMDGFSGALSTKTVKKIISDRKEKEPAHLLKFLEPFVAKSKFCYCAEPAQIDFFSELGFYQPSFPLVGNYLHVLSLFSGCGGMDIGFEGGFKCLKRSVNQVMHKNWVESEDGNWVNLIKTGFKTVFANDIRPDAKAAWCSYFEGKGENANEVYHLESIVELVKKAREDGKKVFPEHVDIVTGGFPCQDFSVAGKRLGFNSDKSHDGGRLKTDEPSEESRGKLYMWMRDVISISQPKIFIAENVKGLTNLNDVKEIIEHDFSDAADGGYLVLRAQVLHAADYGVPQSRERVIFLGFKKSALTEDAIRNLSMPVIPEDFNPYPPKTHAFTVQKDSNLAYPVTCEEAFVDLEEPDKSNDINQKTFSRAKYLGNRCQGQTEVKLNSIGPTIRSEHHGNIEFRRLNNEHGGKMTEELNRGLVERRLSVRECARIQTFPDDYSFIVPAKNGHVAVSGSKAYIVIGNAVPCLLAYNIAMNLRQKWDKYFKKEEEK